MPYMLSNYEKLRFLSFLGATILDKFEIREPTPEETREMWESYQKGEHLRHRELLLSTVESERRRLIGLVLTHFARARRSGNADLAKFLDELATEMENS